MNTLNTLQNKIKLLEKRINSPKTDLGETEDNIYIRMELPVDNYTWNIKDDVLLYVSYEKKFDVPDYVKMIYTETNYGTSLRRVKLPCKVTDNIVWENWRDGVWILILEKEKEEEKEEVEQKSMVLIEINQIKGAETAESTKMAEGAEGTKGTERNKSVNLNVKVTESKKLVPDNFVGTWADECLELPLNTI